MTRSKRLERIRALRQLAEERAAGDLAAARQEIAGRRQALAQLEAHREDYLARAGGQGPDTRSAASWRNERQFLRTLDQVIDQQSLQAVRDQALVDRLRSHWQLQYAARRAVEKLNERVSSTERRKAERREQSAQDDRNGAQAHLEVANAS